MSINYTELSLVVLPNGTTCNIKDAAIELL